MVSKVVDKILRAAEEMTPTECFVAAGKIIESSDVNRSTVTLFLMELSPDNRHEFLEQASAVMEELDEPGE